jgi:hypothetical protein
MLIAIKMNSYTMADGTDSDIFTPKELRMLKMEFPSVRINITYEIIQNLLDDGVIESIPLRGGDIGVLRGLYPDKIVDVTDDDPQIKEMKKLRNRFKSRFANLAKAQSLIDPTFYDKAIKALQYSLTSDGDKNLLASCLNSDYECRGDISCDSASGFDGCDGRPSCWDLCRLSRSTRGVFCISDAFDGMDWKLEKSEFDTLINIAKIFSQMGMQARIAVITQWRKGYDYTINKITADSEHVFESEYPTYYRVYAVFVPEE